MEIKPVDESKDPKFRLHSPAHRPICSAVIFGSYGKITLQKGIREYNAELSEFSSWGLGGLPREQPPTLDEMLDSYTLDQLRELYDAKRCTDKFKLEQEIEEAEEEIRAFKDAYEERMAWRDKNIAHVQELMKKPCEDPSAMVHNIEIQIASKDVETEHYERKLKPMKEHLQRLNKRLFTFNTADLFSLSTLKRKAAEKFGVDISKPKPHPDALRDPLYHDDVTDKI